MINMPLFYIHSKTKKIIDMIIPKQYQSQFDWIITDISFL